MSAVDMEQSFASPVDEKDPLQEVVQAGLGLLVRREHSRLELYRKLASRGYGSTLIEGALDQLVQQGQLSEGRFTEQYISARIRKGYGPVRILQELGERGITEALAESGFSTIELDWYALMEQTCVQKFGTIASDDYKEQAKRARFLEYRGFQHELIRDLIWG